MPVFKLQAALSTFFQILIVALIVTTPPFNSNSDGLLMITARMMMWTFVIAMFAVGIGLASVRGWNDFLTWLTCVVVSSLCLVGTLVIVRGALTLFGISLDDAFVAVTILCSAVILFALLVSVAEVLETRLRRRMEPYPAHVAVAALRPLILAYYLLQLVLCVTADTLQAYGWLPPAIAFHFGIVALVWPSAIQLDARFKKAQA